MLRPALALLPVLALATAPLAAQDSIETLTDPLWSCSEPVTQQEMNWCAHQDFLAVDILLNRQWDRTAAIMHQRDADRARLSENARTQDQPGHFAALRTAQRAWIAFRDAHCASEGNLYRGGSMAPLVIAICKTDLTRQRIAQLRNLADFPETESLE